MDLIKVINEHRSEILNDSILIEYDLFFKCFIEKRCRFVIDDNEELEELDDVIFKIKRKDRNAEIFVSTYGIDFTDEPIHVYADTLWINTIIELEGIFELFRNFPRVEPSDIVLLKENETIDGTVSLVVLPDDKVEDYKSFINKRQINKIKSLYWD